MILRVKVAAVGPEKELQSSAIVSIHNRSDVVNKNKIKKNKK
jgi:hypothetical protein